MDRLAISNIAKIIAPGGSHVKHEKINAAVALKEGS